MSAVALDGAHVSSLSQLWAVGLLLVGRTVYCWALRICLGMALGEDAAGESTVPMPCCVVCRVL
jgi:hypothetical protein